MVAKRPKTKPDQPAREGKKRSRRKRDRRPGKAAGVSRKRSASLAKRLWWTGGAVVMSLAFTGVGVRWMGYVLTVVVLAFVFSIHQFGRLGPDRARWKAPSV